MPTEEQEREARIEAERKNVEIRFRAMYKSAIDGTLHHDDLTAIATTTVNRLAAINGLERELDDARHTMDVMQTALDDSFATIKAQRQEILTLKAALYDLMSA